MPHDYHFACTLRWTGAASGPTSSYAAYDRSFSVDIDGKPTLHGSAAPVFRGSSALHNPEDLLVAALSSCHMLSYLALCARRGIEVVAYEDSATGTMKTEGSVTRFVDVLLTPRVLLRAGSNVRLALALHEQAHAECFIANSVNFPVRHTPEIELAP